MIAFARSRGGAATVVLVGSAMLVPDLVGYGGVVGGSVFGWLQIPRV